MPDTTQEKKETANIFEEFWADEQDIEKLEKRNEKDVYFYIWLAGSVLKAANVLLFLTIVVLMMYTTIQKSTSQMNLSFLEPICFLFVGNDIHMNAWCTGVSSAVQKYSNDLENLKKNQFAKISKILGDVYSSQNFVFSKEVTFLLDKSKNRTLPLDIISAFDNMKTTFEPIEKNKIKCAEFTIYAPNIVEVTCEAYSSDWDKEIVWFDGEKINADVEGTSISLANSFINYIEKSSEKFAVLEKQKSFTSTRISDSWVSYTRKTVFTLKLLYNNNSL